MRTNPSGMWRSAYALVVVSALVGGGRPCAAAPEPAAAETPKAPAPAPSAGTRSAVSVLEAPKSRLLCPADAEIWADAQGTPLKTPAGVPAGSVRKVSVLVFRPRADTLGWNDFIQLYVGAGRLEANPELKLGVTGLPKVQPAATAPLNTEETNVYETRDKKEILVLGFIRNNRSQHLLTYAVSVSGTLNNAQALIQARSMVQELAENARRMRLSIPRPAGAVAAAPTWRIEGTRLRQLVQSIAQDTTLSNSVKQMATIVIPQATAVEHSTYRTTRPISDQAFVEFYTLQTARQGWGPAISRDTTQLGRPALLFQRPYDGAVVLVRAQPSTLNEAGMLGKAATTIHILVIEGKIDVSRLQSR